MGDFASSWHAKRRSSTTYSWLIFVIVLLPVLFFLKGSITMRPRHHLIAFSKWFNQVCCNVVRQRHLFWKWFTPLCRHGIAQSHALISGWFSSLTVITVPPWHLPYISFSSFPSRSIHATVPNHITAQPHLPLCAAHGRPVPPSGPPLWKSFYRFLGNH